MAELYLRLKEESEARYFDRRTARDFDEWKKKLAKSCAVYVGNLNYYTTEDQLYAAFSKTGIIRRVIMGLNKHTRAPCGFAFVEYHRPLDAQLAIALLNGSSCDGRVIRVDADSGQDLDGDRKYGRGFTGRQWRDEYREEYDPGRGGEGKKRQREEAGYLYNSSSMLPSTTTSTSHPGAPTYFYTTSTTTTAVGPPPAGASATSTYISMATGHPHASVAPPPGGVPPVSSPPPWVRNVRSKTALTDLPSSSTFLSSSASILTPGGAGGGVGADAEGGRGGEVEGEEGGGGGGGEFDGYLQMISQGGGGGVERRVNPFAPIPGSSGSTGGGGGGGGRWRRGGGGGKRGGGGGRR